VAGTGRAIKEWLIIESGRAGFKIGLQGNSGEVRARGSNCMSQKVLSAKRITRKRA
jgi:hypothetical protein